MLTLFHDVTDPASAIAVARYTRLARDGVDVTFEGFEAVGLDVVMPVDVGVLAALEDLADVAAAEGVVLRRPPAMPPTGLAHVLIAHAETTPQAHDVRAAVYAAHWREGRDIADPAVLVEVAAAAGLDREPVAALLADRVALAQRRREMAAHRRDGVGGVPVVLASQTLVPALLEESQIRELAAAI
ncbi:DsbA family protein [Euzebya sp.]|uniref:DsbA family oxidoreductase n=1 Tax=Euzebya sp. TaxID=1971409 RepID=UPI003513C45A